MKVVNYGGIATSSSPTRDHPFASVQETSLVQRAGGEDGTNHEVSAVQVFTRWTGKGLGGVVALRGDGLPHIQAKNRRLLTLLPHDWAGFDVLIHVVTLGGRGDGPQRSSYTIVFDHV